MELFKAIAMLCALHNNDSTAWNLKEQARCQADLAQCMLDNHGAISDKERRFLTCIKQREISVLQRYK